MKPLIKEQKILESKPKIDKKVNNVTHLQFNS